MKDRGVDLSDPHYANGFNSAVTQTESNVRAHQAQEVGKRQEAAAYNNVYHEALGIFDDARVRGLPPTSVAQAINQQLDLGISVGMDPKVLNGIITDAVWAESLEQESLAPFEVLNQVKTGPGFLGRTVDVLNARKRMSDMLAEKKQHDDDFAWRDEQRRRTVVEQESNKTIFDELYDAEINHRPADMFNVSKAYKALGDVNPNQAEAMTQMFKNANKAKAQTDDEDTKFTLYNDGGITGTLSQRRVNAAYSSGLLTVETAKDLTDRITARTQRDLSNARAEAAENRANKPKTFDQLDAYQEARKLMQKNLGDDPMKAISPEIAKRVAKATFMFNITADDFVSKHPNATIPELNKNAAETMNSIMSIVDPGGVIAKQQASGTPGTADRYQVSPSTPLEQLIHATQPIDASIPTARLFPNNIVWTAAKDEFDEAVASGDAEKIWNSAIGIQAKKYNVPGEALQQFVNAQDALFTTTEPPVATGGSTSKEKKPTK